jgi:hypothetical protein
MFLGELNNMCDLLKAIWKRAKFVILAEGANLYRSKHIGLEGWIDLVQWNLWREFVRHLIRYEKR